jgi:hypothetical protein
MTVGTSGPHGKGGLMRSTWTGWLVMAAVGYGLLAATNWALTHAFGSDWWDLFPLFFAFLAPVVWYGYMTGGRRK